MNPQAWTSMIRLARGFLWLLIAFAIGLEDFRRVEQFTVTHSHPYERGAVHSHPEFLGLEVSDPEDSRKPDGRDPNRHSHLVEAGFEVPSTAVDAATFLLPLHPDRHPVAVPQELRAPSRKGEGLLRPPRAA